MSGQWQPISSTEAIKHPLYGVRGWLLFFAIGNFLGPLISLGQVNSEAFKNNLTFLQLLEIDHPSVNLLKAGLLMEIALSALILFLLLAKNRNFRTTANLGRLLFWPILCLIAFSEGINETGSALAITFFPWALSCAVWVTYLQRSKRVRVTFENAVRRDDPVVLTKPANVSIAQGTATKVTPAASGFAEHSTAVSTQSTDTDVPQRSLTGQVPLTTIATDIQMDDDAIYATVADELESGKTDKGLWTRLFAECGGDDKKTKVMYITRRAEKLMAAEMARRELLAIQEAERQQQDALKAKQAEQQHRLSAGLADADLVVAVLAGNWSKACQILEGGVSPFGSSDDGEALIDAANRRGDRQMVDLLKAHQIKSMSPQVAAALNRYRAGLVLNVDEVCLLVEAAVTYRDFVMMHSDGNGYTLLHWCGRLGLDKSVDALLDLGADATALNSDGKPAHLLTQSTALANRLEAAANTARSAV